MGLRKRVSTLVAPMRWRVKHRWSAFAARQAVARFPMVASEPHTLPSELIVSLTSFPARYPTLPMTLKSLLDQKVRPDRTILWIADGDWDALTPDVWALCDHGLSIMRCDDVRSYNKIIHALERWPEAFIVTADDDIYYSPNWLRRLVEGYLHGEPAICARRAHRVLRTAEGCMAPYESWVFDIVSPAGTPATATELFPTGIGGVIYPPGSLSPETTDQSLFTRLCPTADDLWLYWMGRRANARYRQVGPAFPRIVWEGSQTIALYANNALGGNDTQIAALERHFGCV
jgi:hypothetical protein